MKEEKNIAFVNVDCPNAAELKNLKSIAVVAGEKIFIETISYVNSVEVIKDKLEKWINSFEGIVYLNTTRQKEIEIIKLLLERTETKEKVKVKVYLKMIFEEMFAELKKKGFSLLRISFLYDLSQKHFENKYEDYSNEESTNLSNIYAAGLKELNLAKINRKALISTINYLRSLKSIEDLEEIN